MTDPVSSSSSSSSAGAGIVITPNGWNKKGIFKSPPTILAVGAALDHIFTWDWTCSQVGFVLNDSEADTLRLAYKHHDNQDRGRNRPISKERNHHRDPPPEEEETKQDWAEHNNKNNHHQSTKSNNKKKNKNDVDGTNNTGSPDDTAYAHEHEHELPKTENRDDDDDDAEKRKSCDTTMVVTTTTNTSNSPRPQQQNRFLERLREVSARLGENNNKGNNHRIVMSVASFSRRLGNPRTTQAEI